jgi:CRISPR-associated protein Cmx8
MAKAATKSPKPSAPESLEVRYELDELPTAQHKAGLAGLLLQIDSMNERKAAGTLPEDVHVPEIVVRSAKVVVIRFMKSSVQDLLDDAYSAEVVEVRSARRWPGAAPKREEANPSPGAGKPKRWFVYDVVQPIGPALRKFLDENKESWHKLWRDMLWKVPRGRPTTRTPFNARARDEPTNEGNEAWRVLLTDERLKSKGTRHAVELAGAVMLGAQAINAELVRFEGRADLNILLHFWPLTVRVFVPEVIDTEGRREYAGFVLAIPDVANVVAFNRAYTRLLNELRPDRRGYRPADALIALPDQGPLEFMRHLDDLATRKVVEEGPSRHLAGVEFFHLVPAGQNVKLMAHGRLPPDDGLLTTYAGIRQVCHNPLMMSCRLLAALRGDPWFAALADPLVERAWWFFVHSKQERTRTPSAMVGFAWDTDHRFKLIQKDFFAMKEKALSDAGKSADTVDRLVYELVGAYVRERACARSGVKPDDQEWWLRTAEERRDVCSRLFLELRSRNDDDFVRHFTATIGSVPQWLDCEKYLAVTAALMRAFTNETGEDRPRTRDDVKTLTLLALSAHSRSVKSRDDAQNNTANPHEESEG